MLKTLLYINEDLASSIALRYTDYLNKFIKLALFVTHVEEPDDKDKVGTGWVRRTWEEGVTSSGGRLIDRMLHTENIDCHLAGRPKVFVGEHEREVIYELRSGNYQLFVQGYLNTSDSDDFFELIKSPLCTDAPCPILLAKNLTISKKCVLLCGDSVDPELLVEKSMAILDREIQDGSAFSFDVIFFRFMEQETLQVLDRSEGGSVLQNVVSRLADAGKEAEKVAVLSGTPEQVGDYLKAYALVVSTLPTRKCMRMHVLANSLASVLLVR